MVIVLADIQPDRVEVVSLELLQTDMESLHKRPSETDYGSSMRGQQPPYMASHPRLHDTLEKILGSIWFRRAWCRHEMKVARDHVFLVDCVPFNQVHHVFRFTGGFMSELMNLSTEVPLQVAQEQLKPALYGFFQNRSRLGSPEGKEHTYQSFSTVIAEVFRMEAGGDPRLPVQQRSSDAHRDRMVIVLNATHSGLAIKPGGLDDLSEPMCLLRLMLVALACGDAGALCSVGKPLRLPLLSANNSYCSWLFEPSPVDSGLNRYRLLPPISVDGISLQQGRDEMQSIRMQVIFLYIKTDRHSGASWASGPIRAQAADFLTRCLDEKLGKHSDRYLIKNKAYDRLFGDMNEVYTETLACVFECGDKWLEDVCRRYKVSGYSILSDLQVVQIASQKDWWTDERGIEAAHFLMDFVNFVILRGMPLRQISHTEEWHPLWMETDSGRCLTFAPRKTVRIAVPAAVRDENYLSLARAWVLGPSGEADKFHGPWNLWGKSVLFSDASFTLALSKNTAWPSSLAQMSGRMPTDRAHLAEQATSSGRSVLRRSKGNVHHAVAAAVAAAVVQAGMFDQQAIQQLNQQALQMNQLSQLNQLSQMNQANQMGQVNQMMPPPPKVSMSGLTDRYERKTHAKWREIRPDGERGNRSDAYS